MDRAPSSDTPASPATAAVARSASGLQLELDQARADFDRLNAEYEELLADPGVNQEDRDATRTLVETARGHVQDLEDALARVESGTYGQCTKCGTQIPAERLEALPDADTCVTCS
jgi:RNA polymerase-binding transcription factor DksA